MSNKIIKTFILLSLSLIFLKNTDLFRKTYFILSKNYNDRFEEAYIKDYFSGYCSKESHGYVNYIKNKYNRYIVPKIINLDKKRRKIPYWIFYGTPSSIDENRLILLNYSEIHKSVMTDYMVIDNFNDNCFYLKKKDGNN